MDKEEFKIEKMRELVQEQREESMYEWINDNKTQLMSDFVEMFQDEFDSYCREAFFEWRD